MPELYAFIFCIALGFVGRILYLAESLLAKRTDLMPVTVALDILLALCIGGAFTAYVILSGTPLAPYMFAALGAGYLLTYLLTKAKPNGKKQNKQNKKAREPK